MNKIQEIREEIIEKKIAPLTKRVGIIFDGKQYNIRIPRLFAEKAHINTDKDEFEFILTIPKTEDEESLPSLRGFLIEKQKKESKG